MDEAPRQGLGSFFRALTDFLDERGLRDQVRAAVSPSTRELIDQPPRLLSFIPSRPIDELESALQNIAGVQAAPEVVESTASATVVRFRVQWR